MLDVNLPKVKMRVERAQVTRALAAIFAAHAIEDVAVEDPPLEEVIADLFSRTKEDDKTPAGEELEPLG